MTRRAAAAAVSVVVALAAFGAIVAGSLLGALAGAPPARAATTTAQTAPSGTSTATTALAATTLTTPASTAATTALAATTLTTPARTAVATSAARDTTPPPPPLGVRAAALIEESSDQQLFGENANAELAIASTTKLMTALITLEHTRLNRVFADPDYPLASEDSQIGLEPGERMSVHDLLLAMLLPSADDAADRSRLQRRPRIDQPVRRDDERSCAPARADAHPLLDSERARHAGQLLERERPRQRWLGTTSSTSRSSGSRSGKRTRCCGPETTSAS